jgi:AcrR family transcriptional regulator
MEAALLQIQGGSNFDTLSLRSIAKAAGVVPTAFYRHFASLDELGLALVDESFRSLRAMLRGAREKGLPGDAIKGSIDTLITHVRAHREHWTLIARARYTGSPLLRQAVRGEIRLISSELATDLGRFPVLRDWTTDDLQMVSSLLVGSMIEIVDALLDAPADAERMIAEIRRRAEKQLRLIVLGMPAWRSGSRS